MFSSVSVPLEWFTLVFDMPWMLLVIDIRQGALYVYSPALKKWGLYWIHPVLP